MTIKKIKELTAKERSVCSTKINMFSDEETKYVAEAIAWHQDQKPENGHIPQSTLLIYLFDEPHQTIHAEFFEIELTYEQLHEAVTNAQKNIKHYLKQ